MEANLIKSQSAPTDVLKEDKVAALEEDNQGFISKKISKYDLLKVRV